MANLFTFQSKSNKYKIMKKIGIFGGTFDPVHIGHIECIKHILNNTILDQIIIIPAANPPHKLNNKISPLKHRIKMLELAFRNIKNVVVSNEESGDKPNYTVLTMRKMKKQYPDSHLFFILGTDNLKTIHTWKDYKSFINENDFILMCRGGYGVSYEDCPDLTTIEFNILTKNKIDTPLINISSTEIREAILKGKNNIPEYLLKDICAYIKSNKLFQ